MGIGYECVAPGNCRKAFLSWLIDRFGESRVVITDKSRSYFKPTRGFAPGADHRAYKGLKKRIEG